MQKEAKQKKHDFNVQLPGVFSNWLYATKQAVKENLQWLKELYFSLGNGRDLRVYKVEQDFGGC